MHTLPMLQSFLLAEKTYSLWKPTEEYYMLLEICTMNGTGLLHCLNLQSYLIDWIASH